MTMPSRPNGNDVPLHYESPQPPAPDGPWNFFTAIGCLFLMMAAIAGVGLVVWIFLILMR